MKSRLAIRLLLAWGASAGLVAAREQNITVIIRDFAEVPDTIMRGARTQAENVLGTAGVMIAWISEPAYTIPLSKISLPTELVLDILPAGVTRRNLDPGALGYAVPPEAGAFGSYAGILYERVQRLAGADKSLSMVLGSAFAHELGHLLLGPGRHALSGIMKETWGRAELRLAAEGRLEFHAAERRLLRRNFLRRLEA
jgi:hypothetical protein